MGARAGWEDASSLWSSKFTPSSVVVCACSGLSLDQGQWWRSGSWPSCLTLNLRSLRPVATSHSVAGGTVPAFLRAQPSRYVVERLARCRDVARRVAALPDERSSGCRSTPCSTSSSGHLTDGRPRGLGRDRRRDCALLSMRCRVTGTRSDVVPRGDRAGAALRRRVLAWGDLLMMRRQLLTFRCLSEGQVATSGQRRSLSADG